jgi:hypothetical protein
VKQGVALHHDVLARVRVLDEAVRLTLGEVQPAMLVAYAESETVAGTGLKRHSKVAKGLSIGSQGTPTTRNQRFAIDVAREEEGDFTLGFFWKFQ